MSRLSSLAALTLALAAASPASAQALPPIPRLLLDRAGVACVKVGAGGLVREAFLVVSTGAAETDAELLSWVRGLRWNQSSAGQGEAAPEETWFALPVAFGEAEPPPPPATCGPAGEAGGYV